MAQSYGDWAEEMGAMIAALERRYFGLSVPPGFNASRPLQAINS